MVAMMEPQSQKPLTLSEAEINSMIERAAEKGATNVMRKMGLESSEDAYEIKGLLEGWRSAKRTFWHAIVHSFTTAILIALAVGAAVKLRIMGDPD